MSTVIRENESSAALTPAPSGNVRYLARQPIFDLHNQVYGYELLYRSGNGNSIGTTDFDFASRIMLDNALLFGHATLAEDRRIFLNCTRQTLLDQSATLLPPEHLVLEVLETIPPDEEVIAALRNLKRRGYAIALDDFSPLHDTPAMVRLADYIKVDWPTSTPAFRAHVRELAASAGARLLAEKVETQEEVAVARAEGFELFQGYYFCKPVLMTRSQLPQSQWNLLQLLRALHRNPLDFDEIARLVQSDVALNFRILRLVNSAHYSLRQQVSSIKAALIVIGEEEFRKMASVAVTGALASGKTPELLITALTRAYFCEQMAGTCHLPPFEQYLLGLFSLLPAMLSIPMRQVTELLPLSDEICRALEGAEIRERSLLDWMEHYERGEWPTGQECSRCGVPGAGVVQLYLESLGWATHAVQQSEE